MRTVLLFRNVEVTIAEVTLEDAAFYGKADDPKKFIQGKARFLGVLGKVYPEIRSRQIKTVLVYNQPGPFLFEFENI